MDLFSFPKIEFSSTVGYMKNNGFDRMENDERLLRGTLAGFADNATVVVDLPDAGWTGKFIDILVAAKSHKIKTVVIPDFSHLGFEDCWESAIMDVVELSTHRVRLISIRDKFDSDKKGYISAVTTLAGRVKSVA